MTVNDKGNVINDGVLYHYVTFAVDNTDIYNCFNKQDIRKSSVGIIVESIG